MAITLEYKDAENKLLLLFLIHMMDLPMSRRQINDFVIEKQVMNHFTLGQHLADMVSQGFLEVTREDAQDEATTSYALTGEGMTNLELLQSQIPRPVRNMTIKYIEENRGKIRKGFEKVAHYFPSVENDEYIVKCGVYDDRRGNMLMEIQVPVVTREQAKHIQANWNANYKALYQKILSTLIE